MIGSINTRAILLLNKLNSKYYCYAARNWYNAPSIERPFRADPDPPVGYGWGMAVGAFTGFAFGLAYNPTTGRFAAGQKGVVGNAYNGTANSVDRGVVGNARTGNAVGWNHGNVYTDHDGNIRTYSDSDERWAPSASPASVEAVGVDFVVEVASAGIPAMIWTRAFLMIILLKTAAQQELRPTGGASSAANHW